MPYNENLAKRVRASLAGTRNVTEKKMFGGVAFMLNDHMCVGILGDDLLIRVAPDTGAELLKRSHARPMDFTGRPMKGYLYISPAGTKSPAQLEEWITYAKDFVKTLPPKKKKT